jgi:hypothetical protein
MLIQTRRGASSNISRRRRRRWRRRWRWKFNVGRVHVLSTPHADARRRNRFSVGRVLVLTTPPCLVIRLLLRVLAPLL